MRSGDGYQVDPDEVDKVVRTMFGQIDEFGGLCRQFGQLVPPVKAFGLVASPAAIAAMSTHELIQRALEALAMVLNHATQNVQTAMNNYRATDGGGASGLNALASAHTTPGGLIQRLQSTGLGAGGIHSYLQDQGHQVGAGVAEVHVGSNLSEVRLRPGDLVTTADFTATVGADGRLYANGQPVQAAAGQEARVYRTMPTGPSVNEKA
jgi:hypothetical protein